MASKLLLGGHRGVGENLWIEGRPSGAGSSAIIPIYRENTIKSFLRSAGLGVDFVEFDVQVTSDGVPVIWHDDNVIMQRSEGSDDIRSVEIKDMDLASFKHVVSNGESSGGSDQLVRMFRGVHTRTEVPGGYLAWICAEEDRLPTLSEVFSSVPTSCGFDIEIKMTAGSDVEKTPPEEVDRVVDAIWDEVGRHQDEPGTTAHAGGADASLTHGSGTRNIFFSSFDPDVCIAISRKQQRYPVWFLSGCGLYPHVDPRRTGTSAALDFAKLNNLAGIVLPAKVLLANESMVLEAERLGLGLMTYGLENDEEAGLERQRQLGVKGVIVDDVQALMGRINGRQ